MTLRAAVLDLDGTVYRGGEPIPGAVGAVERLRAAGLDVLFVSNNPTRRPAAFAEKLAAMGVPATADDVLTSGTVTVAYLREEYPDATLFLVGEAGLRGQLRDAGLRVTDDPAGADLVVASYDRGFDYDALTDAMRALHGGAAFVGTDPDRAVPAEDGGLVPGSGAIVGAVAAAAGRDPDRVLGKPDRFTAERVLERLGVPGEDCLLVGDRLDTDVAMGERLGATTALVLTGVTSRDALADADVSPDHVVDSLADVPGLVAAPDEGGPQTDAES